MAGSWSHLTTGKGRFRGTELLDTMGDVAEALEECYGMVWYLAMNEVETRMPLNTAPEIKQAMALQMIAEAEASYKRGLSMSPGMTNYAKSQGLRWDRE